MSINNRDAAQAVISEYRDQLAAINAATEPVRAIGPNPNRVAEEFQNKQRTLQRRVHSARAYVEAKKEVDALKTEQTEARKKLRTDTERRLYGLTDAHTLEQKTHFYNTKRMVREAAGDRLGDAHDAHRGQQNLADLYSDAILANDPVLAKACAATALNRGWGDIADRHFTAYPNDRDLIEDLHVLDTADNPTNFEETLAFGITEPEAVTNTVARVEINQEYGINTAWGNGIEEVAALDAPALNI